MTKDFVIVTGPRAGDWIIRFQGDFAAFDFELRSEQHHQDTSAIRPIAVLETIDHATARLLAPTESATDGAQPPMINLPALSHRDAIAAIEQQLVFRSLNRLGELGGDDFVTEMIGLLLAQTTQQLKDIERCICVEDWLTIHRHTHSMKSSFGNFGANRCRQIAMRLEQIVAHNRVDEFSNLFGSLTIAFTELRGIIHGWHLAKSELAETATLQTNEAPLRA